MKGTFKTVLVAAVVSAVVGGGAAVAATQAFTLGASNDRHVGRLPLRHGGRARSAGPRLYPEYGAEQTQLAWSGSLT